MAVDETRLAVQTIDGTRRIRIRRDVLPEKSRAALFDGQPVLGALVDVTLRAPAPETGSRIVDVALASATKPLSGEGLVEYDCPLDEARTYGLILDGRVLRVGADTKIEGQLTSEVKENGCFPAGCWIRYRGEVNGLLPLSAKRLEVLRDGHNDIARELLRRVVRVAADAQGKRRLRTLGLRLSLSPNEAAQRFLDRVGRSCIPSLYLKPGSVHVANNIRFFAVNLRSPNAFALPNGVIAVDARLLGLFENEAQSAYLLCHEIAHVTHHHWIREMQRMHVLDTAKNALDKVLPREWWAARLLGEAVHRTIANSYSRESERQADRLALQYMIAAGYDPREAPEAVRVVDTMDPDGWLPSVFSSHPKNRDRIAHMKELLDKGSLRQDFDCLREDSRTFQAVRKAAAPRKRPKRKSPLRVA
jgi:Zn-dependent protease with chaperone function